MIDRHMKLRIVLADDSPECLEAMAKSLRSACEVVATASDGSTALQLIKEFAPDVAVLDLQMPGLNGIELTRELMKQSFSGGVVICSVHYDTDLVDAALAAGASAYIRKSDYARDLLVAVTMAGRSEPFSPADLDH